MTWITDSGADAEFKTQEQRTAAEQYVAAHFGSQLTSDEFWNTQAPQMEFVVGMRRRAAEIAARYPAVSPDELARASAIVAPQIQEVADWRCELSRRWRGAPGLCRQRVRIHRVVGLDRVRPDIGAGRARRAGHSGSPACGGPARRPRNWPGPFGSPAPGRVVAGHRMDGLRRQSRCSASSRDVAGRGVRRRRSRADVDGGWRRVDHRGSRPRTARPHRRHVGCAEVEMRRSAGIKGQARPHRSGAHRSGLTGLGSFNGDGVMAPPVAS